MTSRTRDEPGRADARLNRERILAAAREALREAPDASLNSVAKRAGVGPGTLYRHFPRREDLVLAVYQHDVEELSGEVGTILAADPPLRALRVWFERLAEYIRAKHDLGDALRTPSAERIVAETYAPVTAAVAQLLQAAEAAGEVRPGLEPMDVLLLMGFLWRTPDDEAGRAQAERMLDLVLDGLRPTA